MRMLLIKGIEGASGRLFATRGGKLQGHTEAMSARNAAAGLRA